MHLVLFLTYGNSLLTWKTAGILERELSLYQQYCATGDRITIISYGGRKDLLLTSKYDAISVICNKRHLPRLLYGFLVPFVHRPQLKNVDVIKTNQLYGAHVAAWSSKILNKPLVVRSGYDYYEHEIKKSSSNLITKFWAKIYENYCVKTARLILVSTERIRINLLERYPTISNVVVVPNFVDNQIWSPAYSESHKTKNDTDKLRICFFGRFVEQKNLDALVRASQNLPVRLTLIGEGPLITSLKKLSNSLDVDAEFLPRLHQYELVSKLKTCDLFVLPSLYEGHPKSLIEAMTLGMPVLGSDSPGIKEIISPGVTGIMVGPTDRELKSGLQSFIAMTNDQRRLLGDNARRWALAHYSLSRVFSLERSTIRQINDFV